MNDDDESVYWTVWLSEQFNDLFLESFHSSKNKFWKESAWRII